MHTVGQWIRTLKLKPHPEGGFFRETYRAADRIPRKGLLRRFPGSRSLSTAIVFLLRRGQISRLHRIKADELWHFYAGSPVLIHVLTPTGHHRLLRLGPHPGRRETPQAVVNAGCWFGAEIAGRGAFALVGCTVSPGFDFRDLELADRRDLAKRYPRHRRLIERLTPPQESP